MSGISSAIRLTKHAVTSPAAKSAVTKAATSTVVKSAVSTIVLDAAVPVVKDRIEHYRDGPDETRDVLGIEDLGDWDDPSRLKLREEAYEQYLVSQLFILSDYADHLESFDEKEFEAYGDRFYRTCENRDLQRNANGFIIGSLESYIDHLENYAVRDDSFRSYVMESKHDIRSRDSLDSPVTDEVDELNHMDTHIKACERHIDYLLEYAAQDPEYERHAESFEQLLVGDVEKMENAVLASIQYLNYLEEYGNQSSRYQRHVDTFSPTGDVYYSLVAAENELLKRFSS